MSSGGTDAVAADYVVVGAGAMGMAFVDEILTHTDATVALVERRNKPGGHWNDAYPHVRLHQPSFFYGLNSAPLGSDHIDEVGPNRGLSELASGAEVLAYYDHAMQRRFLPSGRVQFFANTEYRDGMATVVPSGETFELTARVAVVDASYMNVTVPATTPPKYEVAEGATVIAPNALASCTNPDGYVVVGAGKTAFDAIMWLLDQQVSPDSVRWVVPRDSWLINRAVTQPGDGFKIGDQLRIIADADSVESMWLGLEAAGQMLRIDADRMPDMYRCATVTEIELEQLRRVTNVIRQGRVRRITETSIELDGGSVETTPGTVHIDCTADGLEQRPIVPVFNGGRITLQTVRACQQVFSAALIGYLASRSDLDEAARNELAGVIPHPDTPMDFVSSSLAHIHNVGRWSREAGVARWMAEARLNPTGGGGGPDLGLAIAAVAKLEAFLAE
ncbi:MAG: NAD(P)/FAD-dependent oxidoreductase [Acidimicrobiales bacterium]|nr:NAD(P)/FAD-dependent oxidoreductase [Acidimicrobiales bacterium]